MSNIINNNTLGMYRSECILVTNQPLLMILYLAKNTAQKQKAFFSAKYEASLHSFGAQNFCGAVSIHIQGIFGYLIILGPFGYDLCCGEYLKFDYLFVIVMMRMFYGLISF